MFCETIGMTELKYTGCKFDFPEIISEKQKELVVLYAIRCIFK